MNLPLGKKSKVRFDSVVSNLHETIKQDDVEGYGKYVGLENITPLDFRIRSWGNTEDGTSFNKLIKPGDTLFSKRRSYLRKVAYSDLNAICSGDILVFYPKDESVLPELLPHIVSTKAFYRRAIFTSAGSLSPRTSWKDLADYEFLLPSMNDQMKIANIFQLFETNLEKGYLLIQSLNNLRDSIIAEKFDNESSNSRKTTLGNLFTLNNQKLGEYDSEPDIFSISKHDGIVLADNYFNFRVASKALAGYKVLEPNDWAYSTIHIDEGSIARNNSSLTGVVSPMYTTMSWTGVDTIPEYLEILLKSKLAIEKYLSNSQGSLNRRRSLSFQRFSSIEFALPKISEQLALVELIKQIDSCKISLEQELKSLKMTEIAFASRIFDADEI
jgi:restriction endonuclease S subunit